jgi:flagellar motor switch protein FliM
MDKTLNQEEFNPLPQNVEGRETPPSKEPAPCQSAEPCDFRRAGILARDQVQAIRSLHDRFARNLTDTLRTYLRGAFEIAVASVDQILYSEFVQHIPDLNYVGSIALHPLEATAAVQLDLPLALPIVDMLLGGTGCPVTQVREVTEIEEEILGSVAQLICRDLEAAWLPVLKLDFRFEHRRRQAQILRLMSLKEKVLSLSLEVRTSENRGMLNLAFPAVAVNALLKELDGQGSNRRQTGGPSGNHRLRSRLEQCRFHAELLSPTAAVSVRKLIHLKVGEVLELPVTVAEPTLFKVENQILFLAHPVAMGDRRAAEMHAKAAAPQLIKEEPN